MPCRARAAGQPGLLLLDPDPPSAADGAGRIPRCCGVDPEGRGARRRRRFRHQGRPVPRRVRLRRARAAPAPAREVDPGPLRRPAHRCARPRQPLPGRGRDRQRRHRAGAQGRDPHQRRRLLSAAVRLHSRNHWRSPHDRRAVPHHRIRVYGHRRSNPHGARAGLPGRGPAGLLHGDRGHHGPDCPPARARSSRGAAAEHGAHRRTAVDQHRRRPLRHRQLRRVARDGDGDGELRRVPCRSDAGPTRRRQVPGHRHLQLHRGERHGRTGLACPRADPSAGVRQRHGEGGAHRQSDSLREPRPLRARPLHDLRAGCRRRARGPT